jgi:hypothetical protein
MLNKSRLTLVEHQLALCSATDKVLIIPRCDDTLARSRRASASERVVS